MRFHTTPETGVRPLAETCPQHGSILIGGVCGRCKTHEEHRQKVAEEVRRLDAHRSVENLEEMLEDLGRP